MHQRHKCFFNSIPQQKGLINLFRQNKKQTPKLGQNSWFRWKFDLTGSEERHKLTSQKKPCCCWKARETINGVNPLVCPACPLLGGSQLTVSWSVQREHQPWRITTLGFPRFRQSNLRPQYSPQGVLPWVHCINEADGACSPAPMDSTRFQTTQFTAVLQIKSFLLLNKQNLLFLFLPPAALRRTQSFKESATPDPLCASVADKACSSRNREGVSQFEQKQFSWLPVQQGKLEVCGSWYKTGGSPGNPPTYVFVDCKELSRMDRLSSSSEMLSSLSPATPSTLRDNWSFLRRMSTECSFLSQRFIASLDTTVFSKATMINWTAGERKKEKRAVSRKIPSYAYPVPGWAQCTLHYKYFAKPPEN